MSDRHLFGWDLPPGVRVSDIPGNRPEDEKWEAIENGFWDKKRNKAKDKILADANTDLTELIDEAIEYGMDIGAKQEEANTKENRFYETCFIQETLEKSGVSQKVIDKVSKRLKGEYDTP